ncbi:hypothetical protein LCGC14_0757660 [marine sediment metagenome]|uniref:Uncharacterized protein n=1 Tax=marine sediment metagenome TaxID=412755 RepID=A0A0F9SMC7_9ZZZZ
MTHGELNPMTSPVDASIESGHALQKTLEGLIATHGCKAVLIALAYAWAEEPTDPRE